MIRGVGPVYAKKLVPAFGGLVTQTRMISSMIGRTLAANRLALALATALPRLATSVMPGLPSCSPRFLAAHQRGLGAFRDHLALMLIHGREDMDGQLVGVRVIHSHELHTALHQRGDEGQVAGQAVELGDDQLCLLLLAGRERLLQFWSVIALAALNLGELIDKRPPPAVPGSPRRPCAVRRGLSRTCLVDRC
jgi:hypothetical protein